MTNLALQYDDYPSTEGLIVMEKPEWVSTLTAAEIMDVAEETVRRLCRDENSGLECQKLRRDWQVKRSSAEAYKKSKGGRPKSD